MLNKLIMPGMLAPNQNPYVATEHYLEYIIDTAEPSRAPIVDGDAALWVRMQNMYYAVVKITRQYKVTEDPKNIHFDEYDMTIYFDVMIPYDRLAITVQQMIQQIIGPANRIFGNIKIYRKTTKYVPKDTFTLVQETPTMNIYQKLD